MTQGSRILVVDDDAGMCQCLTLLLEDEGYAVAVARDAVAALDTARRQTPDLCLLDVVMPGVDGHALCREIVAAGPTAPAVMFVSVRATTADLVAGLDLGAVDYVAKPFDGNELAARVRAALRAKRARDALLAVATTDPLTGLDNRSQLVALTRELIALARRSGDTLSCLMVDVDHFKGINDTYGHIVGDGVLREVARRLRGLARASDVVARYGGEEFILILPETGAAGALAVAQKIRRHIAAARFTPAVTNGDPSPAGPGAPGVHRSHSAHRGRTIPVRVSIGVATWSQEMVEPEALYAAADGALYRAKAQGRDQVALASPALVTRAV